MANYHGTMQLISRSGGKSCVAALAYRSASIIQDFQTGESWNYSNKPFVDHVEILLPIDAPQWVLDIASELKIDKSSALQKLSNIFEVVETRKDSQVYREFEFSLPNELNNEQNIQWATEFVRNVFVDKGMIAITNFHFDIDKMTGQLKPHCHVLLSTRELIENGFGLKQREWNHKNLLSEARDQCAAYQNIALKDHGFEARVDHRSYKDRSIEIEGQPKLGKALLDMAKRGFKLDKLDNFIAVKLKNQFRILKNPELVYSIVTSNHSTFTKHDIARVLNRYIDDASQFQTLYDRLLGSKNLVPLDVREGGEPVYTTQEMLNIEMGLVSRAERLSAQQTHKVDSHVIDKVIAEQNVKLAEHGGLSADQDKAIRHMLSSEQISCVIGFAGAGKTTSLEAAKEAWKASGYKVLGLAPTGKASRNMEDCGVRSLTVHKFLKDQEFGREQLSTKSVVVLDEAGMVDSRRFSELLAIIDKTGAKVVPMGDNNQTQAIEAGPAFRLLTERVKPAVLETIVRQKVDWQKDATQMFGMQQADKALALYLEKGAFKIINEKSPLIEESYSPENQDVAQKINSRQLLDKYCLARQMSGRIHKEMVADYEKDLSQASKEPIQQDNLALHQDYKLYENWKNERFKAVGALVENYESHIKELQTRGVDVEDLGKLVDSCRVIVKGDNSGNEAYLILRQIDGTLRQMSYSHIVDTREGAKKALVEAWVRDRTANPDQSYIMLAYSNKDTLSLNERARHLMRQAGVIKGPGFTYETHSIEKDDFGKEVIIKQERTFAEGDRILFTNNNAGLGVKNGTLGTITYLDKNKVRALLDGREVKEVSFASRLYPYVDNGWATNIIKSQSITVDHVKMLASYEVYRNLAYVGMSRHRETLEVFGSSLDFWREEKVIDRLSRVQEKLSGFDYVNSEKIENLIKEDAKTIWYEQKLQEGKDFWSAVKGTAKSAVDQILERSKDTITIDPLASFEHSEEKRSGHLFKGDERSLDSQESIRGSKNRGVASENLTDTKSSQPHTNEIAFNTNRAVQQFIDLSEAYESLHWSDPKNKQAMNEIEKFSAKHMVNPEFVNNVMNSGNSVAIERLEIEIGEQKHLLPESILKSQDLRELTQNELSPEKAAQHFIELCSLYETLAWDDPRDKLTLREIEVVVGKYMHHKEFREHIEQSKNEVAIERMNKEIEEKLAISQDISRKI